MQTSLKHVRLESPNSFSLNDHLNKLDFTISKEDYRDQLRENVKAISRVQEQMYANHKQSLLLVFQAMDAAGKDRTIERVVTGVNPQGVEVHSFKKPTELDLAHDFLWRINLRLPPKGKIGIRRFVKPVTLGAVAAGADGVIVEMHQHPEKPKTDAAQTIGYPDFEQMLTDIRSIRAALAQWK